MNPLYPPDGTIGGGGGGLCATAVYAENHASNSKAGTSVARVPTAPVPTAPVPAAPVIGLYALATHTIYKAEVRRVLRRWNATSVTLQGMHGHNTEPDSLVRHLESKCKQVERVRRLCTAEHLLSHCQCDASTMA